MGRSDAFGGSPIFRYVDNENLGSVVASPGAGDVSLPSYASLGPIVSYNTIAPSDEAGGMLSYTLGDDDLQRTFVKLETGDINGFSAYISRSKTDSDLWRGPGTIDREHIEGKIRYEMPTHSSRRLMFRTIFSTMIPHPTLAPVLRRWGPITDIPKPCRKDVFLRSASTSTMMGSSTTLTMFRSRQAVAPDIIRTV